MERCDFASITHVLRQGLMESRFRSQMEFADALLFDYLEAEDAYLDAGLLNRWFNGLAKLSPAITKYYLDEPGSQRELARALEEDILPELSDEAQTMEEIHNLLLCDPSISEQKKRELSAGYPETAAKWLANLLVFGMARPFQARDVRKPNLLSSGQLSPVLAEYVIDEGAPDPCRHFCGREQELKSLHDVLLQNSKVFAHGIPGIGKSELVKAYAKAHRKEYTNILYLAYSGSLKRDIAELLFADDALGEDETARFRRHNRFLRSLREDTLLIIDNFNPAAERDEVLDVVLKYRCRVLITTRGNFQNQCCFPVAEMEDAETLFQLAAKFFSDAEAHRNAVTQIIETGHRHTFAVELAAKLLETGILEPEAVLEKLRTEKASFSASDQISTAKDGAQRKATYYDHIHTLFALFRLSDRQKEILRNLSLAPRNGISARLFGEWQSLSDLNEINMLVELGFVQAERGRRLSLHPMMWEVVFSEIPPSMTACHEMLKNVRLAREYHGVDLPYHNLIFRVIENAVDYAEKDDPMFYYLVLQDVYLQMVDYGYTTGMRLLLSEMERIIHDPEVDNNYNRAILYCCKETYSSQPKERLRLLQKALACLLEATEENARLYSNIHANLGMQYREMGRLEEARTYMETAIDTLRRFDQFDTHDAIAQSVNYAMILGETGEIERGLQVLRVFERPLESAAPESSPYAQILHAKGRLFLLQKNRDRALESFQQAMQIYSALWAEEPHMVYGMYLTICRSYQQCGLPLPPKSQLLPEEVVGEVS